MGETRDVLFFNPGERQGRHVDRHTVAGDRTVAHPELGTALRQPALEGVSNTLKLKRRVDAT